MKIYTITYDLTKPTSKQVNIPNFTNCKLGVAIYKGDEKLDLQAGDVRLVESTGVSIPMLNKYAGFMTAELSIGACNEDRKFKVTLDKGEATKGSFDLLVNVDKSSVIEEYPADAPEYIVRKFNIEYEDGTLETMNVVTEP